MPRSKGGGFSESVCLREVKLKGPSTVGAAPVAYVAPAPVTALAEVTEVIEDPVASLDDAVPQARPSFDVQEARPSFEDAGRARPSFEDWKSGRTFEDVCVEADAGILEPPKVPSCLERARVLGPHRADDERATGSATAGDGRGSFGRSAPLGPRSTESFCDTRLVRNFLSRAEAGDLLESLRSVTSTRRKVRNEVLYELRTDYYGVPRDKDGALALDRWGSNYESWARVEPVPPHLAAARRAVIDEARRSSADDVDVETVANSIAVNYYVDERVPIPAHQDSVTSLVDRSPIYILSLGASRDVCLCDVGDAGETTRARLHPVATFSPRAGDLLVLGPETNARYCHCVPEDDDAEPGLRVSVVFRSVDKTYVTRDAEARVATYATGANRVFRGEAVTVRETSEDVRHLSDLITTREARKKRAKETRDFYLGRGQNATLGLVDAPLATSAPAVC